MKIGISGFAWTAAFGVAHLMHLPRLKQIGFDGLEIPMFDPSDLPIEEIRESFEAAGMECTVCAILPKSVNPISPNGAIRQRAIEHLTACVEASAAMGAHLLCGPLFSPIGYLPKHRPREEESQWAVEAFQALEHVLDATDMTLAIEPVNRSETFFLRTAAEAKRLCDSIGNPRIGITIDTFHANIEELSIPRAIESLGPQLKHLHASENDRGPLGQGHVPFPEILSALRKISYTGYLMIEGFGYDTTEKDAPGSLWAHKSISPENLAFDSARYLTSVLRN